MSIKTALLIVDVQPTFCEEGSLPVDGGNLVAKKISDLIGGSHGYDIVVTKNFVHQHSDFVDVLVPNLNED